MMDFHSKYKLFSQEATERLMERLKAEEEEKGNSVHLCLRTKHHEFHIPCLTSELTWFQFHGHLRTPAMTRLDERMVLHNETSPPELRLLINFGCTVWKSKIYLVGGYFRKDDPFFINGPICFRNPRFIADHGSSQKVFVYDTHSKEWQTTVMNNGNRGYKPIVVAAEDKIFVFGGYESPQFEAELEGREKAIQVWSEFCDATEDTPEWHYLPNHVPDYLIVHLPQTSAVHQRGKQILFWSNTLSDDAYNNVVFSYNYDVKEWRQYEATASICRGPYWSLNKVVVIEDFVFWYHGWTIYAHDLISDTTSAVYQVPELPTLGAHVWDILLVHLGKAKLALFCCADDIPVWCHTILVRIRRVFGALTLHVVPGCTVEISVPDATLACALEVPY